MKIKQNQDILKSVMLTLISVVILTSVYYLNLPEKTNGTTVENSEYLKSEICYYTLQGVKSDYHYHLQLNITINGERIEIPTNIGFEKDENGETLFLHPIHTYDNSGRVHVETTKNATAKLGFFFEIWGEEFSSEKIMGYSVNETHNLEMTVNEQKVDTFEETILEPLIEIEITYKKID
tara:strand:- start:95 stop:631 length:537 start_codon:yes stop_codon:yes gene_type:complete